MFLQLIHQIFPPYSSVSVIRLLCLLIKLSKFEIQKCGQILAKPCWVTYVCYDTTLHIFVPFIIALHMYVILKLNGFHCTTKYVPGLQMERSLLQNG